MRESQPKLTPATIDKHIIRALSGPLDPALIMQAAQASGLAEPQANYSHTQIRNALLALTREALEVYASTLLGRPKRGRVAWRRKLTEMWSTGELNAESAFEIVKGRIACLAGKLKGSKSKPSKGSSWACSSEMGSSFKVEHSTGVALCKAVEHMNNWTGGFLNRESFSGQRVNRLVNQMIQAAAEAVMNYVPESPLKFREPFVFEARAETEEEKEIRELLECLSK